MTIILRLFLLITTLNATLLRSGIIEDLERIQNDLKHVLSELGSQESTAKYRLPAQQLMDLVPSLIQEIKQSKPVTLLSGYVDSLFGAGSASSSED